MDFAKFSKIATEEGYTLEECVYLWKGRPNTPEGMGHFTEDIVRKRLKSQLSAMQQSREKPSYTSKIGAEPNSPDEYANEGRRLYEISRNQPRRGVIPPRSRFFSKVCPYDGQRLRISYGPGLIGPSCSSVIYSCSCGYEYVEHRHAS